MKIILTVLMALLLYSVNAVAGIKTVGKGDTTNFDAAAIPANLKPNFEIMKSKCTRCHSLERVVVSVTTGVASITGQPFDRKAIKLYGLKMLRKPESNMNKREVSAVVDLLDYLTDEAAK